MREMKKYLKRKMKYKDLKKIYDICKLEKHPLFFSNLLFKINIYIITKLHKNNHQQNNNH